MVWRGVETVRYPELVPLIKGDRNRAPAKVSGGSASAQGVHLDTEQNNSIGDISDEVPVPQWRDDDGRRLDNNQANYIFEIEGIVVSKGFGILNLSGSN